MNVWTSGEANYNPRGLHVRIDDANKHVPLTPNVMKEIHHLMKEIDGLTDGQAKFIQNDGDNYNDVILEITANDGYYKDEKHTFEITLDRCYPEEQPQIQCTTTIYHPNINTGTVCVNFPNGWIPCYGLASIVAGLVDILHNPNYEDPLSSDFMLVENETEFEQRLHCLRNGLLYHLDTDNYVESRRSRNFLRAIFCCCRH